MQQVIIAIHLMVVIALVVLVLYQKSEGGALGMGSSGFMTGRGQANALTRATGILGAIFFLTSLALTVLPAWERRAQGGDDWTKALDSKIELNEIKPDAKKGDGAAAPGTAGDAKESIFDQLQRAQQQRQSAPPVAETPAAPPAPAEAPALRSTTEPPAAESKPETAPKAEAPKAEEPKVEAPKVEAPKTEPAKPDAPVQWPSPTR